MLLKHLLIRSFITTENYLLLSADFPGYIAIPRQAGWARRDPSSASTWVILCVVYIMLQINLSFLFSKYKLCSDFALRNVVRYLKFDEWLLGVCLFLL